jgi:hypothetical protein
MPSASIRIDLVTDTLPELNHAAILKEFARSIRRVVKEGGLDPELHWRKTEDGLVLTLGEHQLELQLYGIPYWGDEESEDTNAIGNLWEYGVRAAWMERDELEGTEGLEDRLVDAKVAVLLKVVQTSDPQVAFLTLCHLAAAAMDRGTAAMIVPGSGALHPATIPLCEALHQATTLQDVLQYILRTETEPTADLDQLWYIAYGLGSFDLPDVGMRFGADPQDCPPDLPGLEEAAVAVQSTVSYLLDRRQAVPPGDTVSVGEGETLSVIAAEYPQYGDGGCGGIELKRQENQP